MASQRLWIGCLIVLISASPASGQTMPGKNPEAEALQAEAMTLYKQRDFTVAIERLELARELAPENEELLRHLGSCHAMNGDREQAYRFYREYVERCPKCMYAPQLRDTIRQYEEQKDRPPDPPDPPRSSPEPPREPPPPLQWEVRKDVLEPPDPATQRAELLAKRLLSNARTIRAGNPFGAVTDCLDALKLVPRAHPLHAEARALFAELTWMPPPPFAAPPTRRADQLRKRAQLLGPLEQAERFRATKPKLAAIMAETAYTWADEDDPSLERARQLLLELVSPEEMKRIQTLRDLNHSQPRRPTPPEP